MNYQSPSLVAMTADLKNIISGGRATKDIPQVSDEQIKFWVISKRAKYLTQKLSKGDKMDSDFVQSICLDLELVDRSLCCNISLECKLLRSVQELPSFLDITRLGPVDIGAKRWSIIDYSRVGVEQYAPEYGRKFIKGFFTDFSRSLFLYYNPDYVPEAKYLTAANIMGILEDPTQAALYNSCATGLPCYKDTDAFPISLKLWNDIKQDILKNELGITMQTVEDTTNNSKADAPMVKK